MTDNGWFAARPSGTEDAYKIYCESFLGAEHREKIEHKRSDRQRSAGFRQVIAFLIDKKRCF